MSAFAMPIQAYPRIVRFLGTHDSGEFGNATCSHCGALGRYETSFVTDDGKQGAAMAGCIKLFPVAQIAREELRLIEKAKKHAKQGWRLNCADQAALEAIEAFYLGTASEAFAMSQVNAAKRSNTSRFRR